MGWRRQEKIPVGISSCLLGEEVRYDGGHKRDTCIEKTLAPYLAFRSFCPEIDIGLGVPRKPIRLLRREGEVACVGLEDPARDYTRALRDCADRQYAWHAGLCGYILKSGSPSCGKDGVNVLDQSKLLRSGRGIYAARLIDNFPMLPVEEEGRLGDPAVRGNFMQRVFVMYRWKTLMADGVTPDALSDFHARHKLILMSHCQPTYRALGPLVAAAGRGDPEEVAREYIASLMQALCKPATRGNHVNVLQHIRGYLKPKPGSEDSAELSDAIDRYHQGLVPLSVPITLLNHHFRRNPHPWIQRSWYMQPWPAGLRIQDPP